MLGRPSTPLYQVQHQNLEEVHRHVDPQRHAHDTHDNSGQVHNSDCGKANAIWLTWVLLTAMRSSRESGCPVTGFFLSPSCHNSASQATAAIHVQMAESCTIRGVCAHLNVFCDQPLLKQMSGIPIQYWLLRDCAGYCSKEASLRCAANQV